MIIIKENMPIEPTTHTMEGTSSMTTPIKAEKFELIELEEPRIQSESVAPIAQSIVKPTSLFKSNLQNRIYKRKNNVLKERIILSQLQQKFYQHESIRTAEMFRVKKELMERKHKLLDIESKLRG